MENIKICNNCGWQMAADDKFCGKCGAKVCDTTLLAEISVPTQTDNYEIGMYEQGPVSLLFCGKNIEVGQSMAVFNHYRKKFHEMANIQIGLLQSEYTQTVVDFDSFITKFPAMYEKHRRPLLEMALKIIVSYGIYDISLDQFTEQHTVDFNLCKEDVEVMLESFNKTIEANQDKKIKGYNMLPGMVFRGLGGFATAIAMNFAMNAIVEADIKNANVTPKQRAELFGRINTENLMYRAFLDYWRVFLSLTWQLKEHGVDMWYPTEMNNQRATGIYQNLNSGVIPDAMKPDMVKAMMEANPYLEGVMDFVHSNYAHSSEADTVLQYFGYGM